MGIYELDGDKLKVGCVVGTWKGSFQDGNASTFASIYIKLSPQPNFPASDAGDKKFNSRPVVPTVFRKEPFGRNVEGFSYCRHQSYNSKLVFSWHGAIV